MKNIISTIKYIFKNFVVLGFFALPAALFFAFKYNDSFFLDYLINIQKISNNTLIDIYAHFSILPSFNLLVVFFWFSVLLFSFCLMFSYIERDMKYGIKAFWRTFNTINETLLVLITACITIFITVELLSFIQAVFVNLFKFSLSPAVPFILPTIYTLMNVLCLMIISMAVMWIPIKLITGYSNRDSLRYAVRLFQGRQFKLFIGLAFPMLVMSPLMLLIKTFIPAGVFSGIIYVIFYIFMLEYYAVFLMVSYFDFTGTYRKDIKTSLFKTR